MEIDVLNNGYCVEASYHLQFNLGMVAGLGSRVGSDQDSSTRGPRIDPTEGQNFCKR